MIAVAEAARNLVCTGAIPTAVTNNLNFGNPLKPHIYFQFREAVLGMADACRLFETPITGGNVSFYNETDGTAIYPTPVIGMVGVIERLDHITTYEFKDEGDAILLLGENTGEMGGSEFLYALHGEVAGEPPRVDLEAERHLQHAVLALIRNGLLRSAHDCSEGGLACALVESALGDGERPIGVDVTLDGDLDLLPLLFGEAQGRVIVSCSPENVDAVLREAGDHGVPCRVIGRVNGPGDRFRITSGPSGVDLALAELAGAFFGAIPRIMDRTPDASSPPASPVS
jgi:phosphoribosylformylglycinamidine synthase